MEAQTMTLTDFLLARLAEDEEAAKYERDFHLEWPNQPGCDLCDPARVLAEVEAKRRIVEWHKNWPILTNTKPIFEQDIDLGSMTMRMSQQMAWLTEQEYRERFGEEPPTGPILRFLAQPYADHPDFREEWRA